MSSFLYHFCLLRVTPQERRLQWANLSFFMNANDHWGLESSWSVCWNVAHCLRIVTQSRKGKSKNSEQIVEFFLHLMFALIMIWSCWLWQNLDLGRGELILSCWLRRMMTKSPLSCTEHSHQSLSPSIQTHNHPTLFPWTLYTSSWSMNVGKSKDCVNFCPYPGPYCFKEREYAGWWLCVVCSEVCWMRTNEPPRAAGLCWTLQDCLPYKHWHIKHQWKLYISNADAL